MYVGVRSTDYSFPPLGANMTPPKRRQALGACCTSCAKASHNPPPMGADAMTGPMGDVVDFVVTPLGLILTAGIGYVIWKRLQIKKANKWLAEHEPSATSKLHAQEFLTSWNARFAPKDLAAAAVAETTPKRKRRRGTKRRRTTRRRRR